jgi:hypothetical protein
MEGAAAPHRRRRGALPRLRQVGGHVCARCALERYRDAGFFIITDPVSAFEIQGRERWRQVAQQLRSGQIRSGRFYLFVGHDDGGPLERPLNVLLDSEQEITLASVAYETGLDLTRRYQQVWVVTTVGCWSVSSGLA